MTTYRLCTVGDDHYAGVTAIECPTDAAALERANQLADGHPVEVWEGGRLIARVDPPRPEAPAAR